MGQTKYEIRSAKVEDAEKIVELLTNAGSESPHLSYGEQEFDVSIKQEEKIIKMFRKNHNAALIVVDLAGEIIALATIDGDGYQKVCHNCEVAMVVAKAYWGQKVGMTLMNYLLKRAQKMEKTNVYLSVKADNKRAINLYESFGFQQFGCQKNYFKVDNQEIDLLHMQRQI